MAARGPLPAFSAARLFMGISKSLLLLLCWWDIFIVGVVREKLVVSCRFSCRCRIWCFIFAYDFDTGDGGSFNEILDANDFKKTMIRLYEQRGVSFELVHWWVCSSLSFQAVGTARPLLPSRQIPGKRSWYHPSPCYLKHGQYFWTSHIQLVHQLIRHQQHAGPYHCTWPTQMPQRYHDQNLPIFLLTACG